MTSETLNSPGLAEKASAEAVVGEAKRLLSRYRPLDALERVTTLKGGDGWSVSAAVVEAGALAGLSRFHEAHAILVRLLEDVGETPQLVLAMIDLELGRGNPLRALQLAEIAAEHFDTDVRFPMRQVAANKMLSRDKSVIEGFRTVIERFPDHVPARMQLADILRRAKDREGAAEQLTKILEIQPGNLVATAYLEFLGGLSIEEMMERSGERARAALDAAPNDEARTSLLIEIADRELFVRRFAKALEYYEEINDPAAMDNRRLLNAARCNMQLGYWDPAIALARRALEQSPNSADAVLVEATSELARGNVDRYVALLLDVEPYANRRHFRQYMSLVFNLHALERHDEAEALLARWEKLSDQIPQQDLVTYYRRRQMEDKIAAYIDSFRDLADDSVVVARMVRSEEGRRPDSDQSWNTREIVFGIGNPPAETVTPPEDLRMLLGERGKNAPQNRNPILTARLGWALCDDKSMGFDEWLMRVRRAAEANRRLSQRPPLLADLAEYVNPPDLAPLQEFIDRNSSFLFVSSHMGPRITYALSRSIPNVVYVTNGYWPIAEIPRIPFAQREPQLTAIKLVSAVRQGYPVLNMVDTPIELGQLASSGGLGAVGSIMGISVTIPGVMPKLSQQLNVPSFFAQPYWEGDRIAIAIERLPDAEADERPSAFANRWAQAYLDKLFAHMRTAPENQNLTAPMWRHLLMRGAMRSLDSAPPAQPHDRR